MKRERPTNPHFVRKVTTGIVVDSGIANCCLCNRKEGTDCFLQHNADTFFDM